VVGMFSLKYCWGLCQKAFVVSNRVAAPTLANTYLTYARSGLLLIPRTPGPATPGVFGASPQGFGKWCGFSKVWGMLGASP
jgi:hypothetical protein